MSQTQEVEIEEVRSTEEYQSLQDEVQDLRDMVHDLQDRLEAVERNGREAEMHDQFNQQSNYGY